MMMVPGIFFVCSVLVDFVKVDFGDGTFFLRSSLWHACHAEGLLHPIQTHGMAIICVTCLSAFQ